MVFVKFWRYFKVIFEVLSDKREMELRKVNNMDDEEEAMLGPRFGAELKVVQKKEMG